MYIIITQYNSSNTEKNNNNSIHLCNNKISNNKTWLSKSNYKQYIISNNKKCKSTLKNIINELRLHFQSTFNGIKITTTSNTTIELETTFNIFTSYLKSLHTITLQSVITTLHSLNEMNTLFQLSKTKAHTPILQAKLPSCKQQYTLVLDLDETLVHFVQGDDDSNDIVQIRPGAEQFIEDLAEYYEIIIFTVAKQDYADIVIDGVDSSRKVSGRLYRNHTIRLGDGYVKDLSKLGRDLTKTLIVDNCAENFRLQPNNGLRIKDFEGDPEDNELEYLKEDLIEMIEKKPNDIRECLEVIQHKMNERNNTMNNEDDVISKQSGDNNNNSHHSDIYIKDNEERSEHDQETSDQEDDECNNDNI
jgi:Dullard-like phosphatase family protein